jgi:hypothetical protein
VVVVVVMMTMMMMMMMTMTRLVVVMAMMMMMTMTRLAVEMMETPVMLEKGTMVVRVRILSIVMVGIGMEWTGTTRRTCMVAVVTMGRMLPPVKVRQTASAA